MEACGTAHYWARIVPAQSRCSSDATYAKADPAAVATLMGHALEGVSAKYTDELMIANSQALRDAQEKISRRIVSLLGLETNGPA
jgi:hypothetical protein